MYIIAFILSAWSNKDDSIDYSAQHKSMHLFLSSNYWFILFYFIKLWKTLNMVNTRLLFVIVIEISVLPCLQGIHLSLSDTNVILFLFFCHMNNKQEWERNQYLWVSSYNSNEWTTGAGLVSQKPEYLQSGWGTSIQEVYKKFLYAIPNFKWQKIYIVVTINGW